MPLGQAGVGIFFTVDALKTKQEGYDVVISFPKEEIGTSVEAVALLKGAKNPALGKKPGRISTYNQQKSHNRHDIRKPE